MFSRIVTSALFAGAGAGLIAALLQLVFVQPVLLHAELYESGTLVHFGAGPVSAQPPLPGLDPMRDGLSTLFTLFTYTGFALVLVAVMSLAEAQGHPVRGRAGILWGLGGFIAVIFAPGLSLAPEVPGVAAADVLSRQIWWVSTVVAAAVALWQIAFGRGWAAWGTAALLLLAPHLIGAPEPDSFAGPVPPEIAGLFAARSFGVAMAGWVILGVLGGYFWQREGPIPGHQPA